MNISPAAFTGRVAPRRVVLGALVAFAALAPAAPAEAAGPYFLVELQGGLGESAYAGGSPGLAYGVAAGTTLGWKSWPVRFYLLGTVIGRNTFLEGRHQGIGFEADRRELDLFVAQRTVIPVWRFLRVYFETGIGSRIMTQTIRRREQLGTLTEESNSLLVVLAVGMQARLTGMVSVGLRGEMTPLDVQPDAAAFAADLQPEPNRLSLFAQVGVHF